MAPMAPRTFGLAVAVAILLLQRADGCTRILFRGANDSYVLSGRSQDWCAARGQRGVGREVARMRL